MMSKPKDNMWRVLTFIALLTIGITATFINNKAFQIIGGLHIGVGLSTFLGAFKNNDE